MQIYETLLTGDGESIENLFTFHYNGSRKILRAERGGQAMRKGYPLDMRSGLSPTGGQCFRLSFLRGQSKHIEVHDDPQGGLVGVRAPQAPLRVFWCV